MTPRITRKRKILRPKNFKKYTRNVKSSNNTIIKHYKSRHKGGWFLHIISSLQWVVPIISKSLYKSGIVRQWCAYAVSYGTQFLVTIKLTDDAINKLTEALKSKGLTYRKSVSKGVYVVDEPKNKEGGLRSHATQRMMYIDANAYIETFQNNWFTSWNNTMNRFAFFMKQTNDIICAVASNRALDKIAGEEAKKFSAQFGQTQSNPANKGRRNSWGGGYNNRTIRIRNDRHSLMPVSQNLAKRGGAAPPQDEQDNPNETVWDHVYAGFAAKVPVRFNWGEFQQKDSQYSRAVAKFKLLVENVRKELIGRAELASFEIAAFKQKGLAAAALAMKKVVDERLKDQAIKAAVSLNAQAASKLKEALSEQEEAIKEWGEQNASGKWKITNDVIKIWLEDDDPEAKAAMIKKLTELNRWPLTQGGATKNTNNYEETLDDLVEMMMVIWKKKSSSDIDMEIQKAVSDPKSDILMIQAYKIAKAKLFNESIPKIGGAAPKSILADKLLIEAFTESRKQFRICKMEKILFQRKHTISYYHSILIEAQTNLVVWTKTFNSMAIPEVEEKIGKPKLTIAYIMLDALDHFLVLLIEVCNVIKPIVQYVYPGIDPLEKQLGNDFVYFLNTALNSQALAEEVTTTVKKPEDQTSTFIATFTKIRGLLGIDETAIARAIQKPTAPKVDLLDYWIKYVEPVWKEMNAIHETVQAMIVQRTNFDKAVLEKKEMAFLNSLRANAGNASKKLVLDQHSNVQLAQAAASATSALTAYPGLGPAGPVEPAPAARAAAAPAAEKQDKEATARYTGGGSETNSELPYYWHSIEAARARNASYIKNRDLLASKYADSMSGGASTKSNKSLEPTIMDFFGEGSLQKYFYKTAKTDKIDEEIPLLTPVVDGYEADAMLEATLVEIPDL